jgi:hypoxanthine phosphoribosyltransferase
MKVLLSRDDIRARVAEMGAEIARDYAGREPHLVGVLKGACTFMTDLAREIELPLTLDYIAVSSYGAATKTSGEVKLVKDLDQGLEGRDLIVVEDIVDTGLTLNYLLNVLRARGPRTLKVAALLSKPSRRLSRRASTTWASPSRTSSWWATASITTRSTATSGTL